jgi:hypothetical protein
VSSCGPPNIEFCPVDLATDAVMPVDIADIDGLIPMDIIDDDDNIDGTDDEMNNPIETNNPIDDTGQPMDSKHPGVQVEPTLATHVDDHTHDQLYHTSAPIPIDSKLTANVLVFEALRVSLNVSRVAFGKVLRVIKWAHQQYKYKNACFYSMLLSHAFIA